jgi:hypothetical protein
MEFFWTKGLLAGKLKVTPLRARRFKKRVNREERRLIMGNAFRFTETIITTVESKKVFRLADECLLEIRLVESKKQSSDWIYEYEVKGEAGRIAKLTARIKGLEGAE